MAEAKRIDVVFHGKGSAAGRMRNDIHVEWPDQGESFQPATEAGPFPGGEGTARPADEG